MKEERGEESPEPGSDDDLFQNFNTKVSEIKRTPRRQMVEPKPDFFRVAAPGMKHPFFRPSDKRIIREWLLVYQQERSVDRTTLITANRLAVPPEMVMEAVRKAKLRGEAKKQRQDILNTLYRDKLKNLSEVGNLSIYGLREWLVQQLQDVTKLGKIENPDIFLKILGSLESLMRLEQGKATQIIEKRKTDYKEVIEIVDQMKKIDPIGDPEELERAVDAEFRTGTTDK